MHCSGASFTHSSRQIVLIQAAIDWVIPAADFFFSKPNCEFSAQGVWYYFVD